MRFGWKVLIPSTLGWVVFVAFMRGARNGWFGGGEVTFGSLTFPTLTLWLIGLVSVGALVASWWWGGRELAKEARLHPEVPDEVDPYAGGHPVPPLPGQRLKEPALAGTLGEREILGDTVSWASLEAGPEDTVTDDATEEGPRE
jgi:NADH-quinone oxidoreductase subunit H